MASMEWTPIPGYEPYELSQDMTMVRMPPDLPRHGNTKPFLTTHIVGKKYPGFNLTLRDGSRSVGLHRLIASVFIPNPENKPEVNHIDGNPLNNSVENLEWVTHAENLAHASRTGLMTHGTDCHSAKLTEAQVLEIRRRHAAGEIGSWNACAREHGITWATLQKVILRRSWRHI